jgi:hypothetical protein
MAVKALKLEFVLDRVSTSTSVAELNGRQGIETLAMARVLQMLALRVMADL